MAHGEEALASAIDVWLLYRAMRELITNPVVGPGVGADYPTGGTDDSWSRGRRRDRWAAGWPRGATTPQTHALEQRLSCFLSARRGRVYLRSSG